MTFSLAKEFPDLVRTSRPYGETGESELADTVPDLTIVERCRCGDDFCATMYTYPPRLIRGAVTTETFH